MYVTIISITIILICGIVSYNIYDYWKKKSEEEIQRYKYEEYKKEKEVVARRIEEELSTSYSQLKNLKEKIDSLNEEIENKKDFNTSLLKIREEELNRLMEEKELKEKDRIQREVEDWEQSAQEAATYNASLLINRYREIIAEQKKERDEILDELEEFRRKREVVNQEILRARALEEQQDFYRIQLTPEAIRDIAVLEDVKPKLSKLDLLDKLIYDVYVKKSADEMIKRVLEGRAPSGIYKITRLKTGEVYIGKSTDIKSRWQQHSKSVFHCGTISHSMLHTTIERDGIENFTWELLEEVPKDKLTEREKYWISFYGSQKYGLNERIG